jgi:hypothetical protein
MSRPKLRETFQSPWTIGPENCPDIQTRNGQPFTTVRKITARNLRKQPDASDFDREVLPMYGIRFADGVEILAWPEEVEAA